MFNLIARAIRSVRELFQRPNPVRSAIKDLRDGLRDAAPQARAAVANRAAEMRQSLEARLELNREGFRQWLTAAGFEVPENTLPYLVNSAKQKQLRLAAVFVAAIEFPFAAWTAHMTFDLGWLAAVLGVIFTLGLTAVLTLYWHVEAQRLQDASQEVLTSLQRALQRNALAWLALWAALLISSRVTDPESALADVAFKLLTTALAIVTPNLLALVLNLVWLIGGESRQYVAADRQLTDAIRQLRAVEEEARIEPPAPPKLRVIYPPQAMGLAFALLLGFSQAGFAADMGGLLRVMGDVSDSPEASARQAAMEAAFEFLPQLATESNITRIELYVFAGDGFSAPPAHVIELPSPPLAPDQAACQPAQTERISLFREAGETARRKAKERCEQEHAEALRLYETRVAELIGEGKRKLLASASSDPQKSCIADALARNAYPTAQPLRGLIVISDGEENCDKGAEALRGHPSPVPAVFVLTPEASVEPSRRRQRFDQLERYWRERAPWLTAIVPPSAFHIGLLLSQKEAGGHD